MLLFDPALLQQVFHEFHARRQSTRLDPARTSQVLNELALVVSGKRHFFTLSPSSTRRRTASESFGLSDCCLAQFSIASRSVGSARKPIMGVMPVGGRPIFCLADIAFFILSV